MTKTQAFINARKYQFGELLNQRLTVLDRGGHKFRLADARLCYEVATKSANAYVGRHAAQFTDVSTISEYGLAQKLSNAIRVF